MKTPQELYEILNAVRLRIISEDEAVRRILQPTQDQRKETQPPNTAPRADSQRS